MEGTVGSQHYLSGSPTAVNKTHSNIALVALNKSQIMSKIIFALQRLNRAASVRLPRLLRRFLLKYG
jgi:hypothetical protein